LLINNLTDEIMSNTKQLIASLDKKVESLLSKLNEEKSLLTNKEAEIAGLSKQLEEKDNLMKQLQEQNAARENVPTSAPDNSEEMKVKISELVREIDKCISLLKV